MENFTCSDFFLVAYLILLLVLKWGYNLKIVPISYTICSKKFMTDVHACHVFDK